MDAAESEKGGQDVEVNGDDRRDAAESTCFKLLNELSDLLMLPKDMLLEKAIRKEVCIHPQFLSHSQVLICASVSFDHSCFASGLPFHWPSTSNKNTLQLHS
jgi:23S rRNA C2498 (ribose-2'-O)-methylase RlmM